MTGRAGTLEELAMETRYYYNYYLLDQFGTGFLMMLKFFVNNNDCRRMSMS